MEVQQTYEKLNNVIGKFIFSKENIEKKESCCTKSGRNEKQNTTTV